jgi:chorismate mutase-like protein
MKSLSSRPFAAIVLATLVGLFAGCVHTEPKKAFVPTSPENRLIEAMVRRLDLSRQVAWVKFENHIPISDPKREAEVLASLVKKGQEQGLAPRTVELFFTAQIRASRTIQGELIGAWKRGATLPAFPPWDLKKHIRPRLDAVSNDMLVALRTPPQPGFRHFAYKSLRQRGFSHAVAAAAVAPLP